jgi:hypothetical protein
MLGSSILRQAVGMGSIVAVVSTEVKKKKKSSTKTAENVFRTAGVIRRPFVVRGRSCESAVDLTSVD